MSPGPTRIGITVATCSLCMLPLPLAATSLFENAHRPAPAEAEAQHWKSRLNIHTISSAIPQADISLSLWDSRGNPITGQFVLLEARHQQETGYKVNLHLQETQPGTYTTHFVASPPGQWSLHFSSTASDGSVFAETRYLSLR